MKAGLFAMLKQGGGALQELQKKYPDVSVSVLIKALRESGGDPKKAMVLLQPYMTAGGAEAAGAAAPGSAASSKPPDITTSPEAWFKHYDPDGNGLEVSEVVAAVGETFNGSSKTKVLEVVQNRWHKFDPDGSGNISLKEFMQPGGLRDTLVSSLGGGDGGYSSGGPNPASAAPAPMGRMCKSGCGRTPFKDHPTCCTHCKGGTGPHARGCKEPPAAAPGAAPSHKCPKGHTLVDYEVPMAGGGCDKCGKPVALGEHVLDCRTCNWYMCSACGVNPSPAAAPAAAPSHPCPKGHTLVDYAVPMDGGGCDKCGKPVGMGEHVLDCRTCNWYMCSACSGGGKPAGGKPAGGKPAGGGRPTTMGSRPNTALHPSSGTGRQKALLIGINYAGQRAELKGCENDVDSMLELLTKTYGWDRNTIRTLRGAEATKSAMEKEMKDLTAGAQPGDSFFWHYSGHGSQQPDPKGYEEDGMNETIIPVDFQKAGMISDDVLMELLVVPLPEGARLTAIMDCCHSGTGLDLPFVHTGRDWKTEVNPYFTACDAQMFSGCEDHATSADVQSKYGAAGGAMTQAFTAILEKNKNPSYTDMINGMNASMKEKGFKQRPQLTSSQAFQFPRVFTLTDAVQNSNAKLGRQLVAGFKPNKPDPSETECKDDRLQEMLGPVGIMALCGLEKFGGKKVQAGIELFKAAMQGR